MSLFWRVFLTNGAVFAAGTLILVLSPATVSAQPLLSEILLLVVGLLLIFAVNGTLLRSILQPLDQLTEMMAAIDMRQPGLRLEEAPSGRAAPLVDGFNAMLGRLEAERASSITQALRAQEAERQRIAAELHDQVGQSLTAVLLGLRQASRAATPEVAAELELVRETVRTSLDEVRRISQHLRPGVLADLGLLGALSALASDLTARTGIVVHRDLAKGLPPLPPETELVAYRVAQEAMTNVIRHAHADTVELGLTRKGSELVLRVADDGVGVAGAASGSGLQGMRERARIVRGRLDIRSLEQGGTEVLLEIPIPQAA